jgi:hypothetical protein
VDPLIKFVDIALAGAAGFGAVLVGTLLVYGKSVARSAPDVARVVSTLGAVVLGLTVYRMVNQPDPSAWFELGVGPWLAILGGAAMIVGGTTRQTYE